MFGFGVIVALAYYLGALFGLHLSFHPNNIASLWAPNGILLAALLLTSPHVWPAPVKWKPWGSWPATLPSIQKPYGIKSLAAIVKSTLS